MDQSLVGQSAVEDVVCPVVSMLCEPDQHPGNAVQVRYTLMSCSVCLLCMMIVTSEAFSKLPR